MRVQHRKNLGLKPGIVRRIFNDPIRAVVIQVNSKLLIFVIRFGAIRNPKIHARRYKQILCCHS